jgi:hypothetical protein
VVSLLTLVAGELARTWTKKKQKRGAIAAERRLAHGGDEPGHRVAGVPASTPYTDVSG